MKRWYVYFPAWQVSQYFYTKSEAIQCIKEAKAKKMTGLLRYAK